MVTLVHDQHTTQGVEFHQKIMHNNYVNNYFMNRKKSLITCANCGGLGHIYRTCNHPTISYGFICYRIAKIDDKDVPLYLMVQRKDSLSYVEFMRGKYDLENKTYIMKLFSHMTDDERNRISVNDFDTLWKDMWCKGDEENCRNYNREYMEASEKFKQLKKGYYIRTPDDVVTFIDIVYFLDNTKCEYEETEWGFPKGRRNVNENDINCALREFKEETGLNVRCLNVCCEMKPLEEVFSGTNKKRYKHVYYVAKFNEPEDIDVYESAPSCREIKDIRWFTYEQAQEHIRDINIERKELLKRLNSMIIKNL